jgi:putative SOS response-associated peptidase YedK
MCGRVVQVSDTIRLSIVDGLGVRDSRLSNYPRRWNGAPSQELLVIRENHKTGERSLDLLTWGLIPYWCTDPKGGRKPINAKSETVATLPTFKDACRRRRCILPVDAFYEWKASKGGKQPYAIAMKDRSPFGIAGIWENWKNPDGEWVRTFAILTTPANELIGAIHDRMPAVLAPAAYDRWLGTESDPRDVLQPFPSELMAIWPISTRVNSPSNDDEQLLEEIELAQAPVAVIAPESSAARPLSDQRTAKTATRQ